MADQVIPIALSQVAMTQYLSVSQELLGRSPSIGIDNCPAQLSDIAKYTASLAELRAGKEVDSLEVLRSPGPHLHHTFYSFMILSSNSVILRVSEGTSLDTLSAPAEDEGRVAIFSGNLAEWRDAIIVCCGPNEPKKLRLLFNVVKQAFDKLGLSDIWYEYSAESHKDGTFYLRYNP
jgi:hypothetical protein